MISNEISNKEYIDLIINTWNNIFKKPDLQNCISRLNKFDSEIFTHSVMVAALSAGIGMELDIKNKEELFIAGLLHDYGKIFIPKYILNKPGNLDENEYLIIQKHPELGYSELRKNTNCSFDILNGVLDHHEKVNGSGYGFNKMGRGISLFGKIIAVADVYSAMVTKRKYRRNIFTHEVAKEYLKENIGIKFEREVTEVFLNNIDKYKIIIDRKL